MTACLHYVFGASLGSGMQPTAIAVVEQEVWKNDNWEAETSALHLRHLERLSLDATYPDTVARINTLLQSDEIKGQETGGGADLILDVTGSGKAVIELFERTGLEPIAVTIVGGGVDETMVTERDRRLPKVELVGTLQVLYQSGRLKMVKDLDLVPTLVDELQAFKMRPPRIDPNDPEAWREGQFDDLVFAVGLAAWRANHHVPTPDIVRAHWDEVLKNHYKNTAHQWV